MGNYYVTICDQLARPDEVSRLADLVVSNLVRERIVDSVSYPWFDAGVAYFIGPAYRTAVLHPERFSYHYEDGRRSVHPGSAKSLSSSPLHPRPLDQELSVTDVCVHVSTSREVHYSMGGDAWCPDCEVPFQGYGDIFPEADEDALERWLDAVGDWHEGGEGRFECPGCGHSLTIFDVGYDPPWAFGNLAFEFWNWGDLRLDFIRDIARTLGHEVVVPYGKL